MRGKGTNWTTVMKPRQLILIILMAGTILAVRSLVLDHLLSGESASSRSLELSRAVQMIKQGAIASATVVGDDVVLLDRQGGRTTTRKEGDISFLETLRVYGVTPEQVAAIHLEVKPTQGPDELVVAFGLAVALLAGMGFLARLRRPEWAFGGADGLDFRRSRARRHDGSGAGLTFEDVAGAEEAKQELREVVEFLRSPARFSSLGARVPRGLLLVGPPGTGKTLLARAVAGEAGVPFFSCSGSEFVEMYVGVGAARIRDLFQRAKKSAPCIVFVDEIDAIGRRRSAGAASEEREHSLNQILVEMDGFDQSINVVVMAATNRPDVLDPALLRPGRFDRRILVDSPDMKGRLAILRVHARGKPLSPDLDLERVAKQTTGFSGADLESVMNEAALLAVRRGSESVGAAEVEEAVDRVLVGLAKKSRVISEREKWITAYHEAGHALVAHQLPNVDPVQRISIIPRGASGGHTRLLPMEDRHLWSRSQLLEAIAFALGGMEAEDLVFGETTTGSAGDLSEATNIARKMVCIYGMGRCLGPMALDSTEESGLPRGLGADAANAADAEIRELLERGRAMARDVLERNRSRLACLAERLFDLETLQGETLTSLLSSGQGATNTSMSPPGEGQPKSPSPLAV